MEQFIELLKEVNIAQILIIFSGGWFFYSRLDNKIEKLSNKIEEVDRRLGEKIDDVDRRLCRIEGSLATQGHCLFHHNKQEQKAE